jgi:TPR repeat protein
MHTYVYVFYLFATKTLWTNSNVSCRPVQKLLGDACVRRFVSNGTNSFPAKLTCTYLFGPNKDVAAMSPRPSVFPLFAAVALIPSALPSVARAQATSPQTYEETNRKAEWLVAEQISANDDSAKPSQIGPADLSCLERARALMKANDIAAARLIFTRLSSNGIAEAAFELGQTYDPDFLQTMHVAGLKPDPDVARQWYTRAAELGNADAQRRLTTLKVDARR